MSLTLQLLTLIAATFAIVALVQRVWRIAAAVTALAVVLGGLAWLTADRLAPVRYLHPRPVDGDTIVITTFDVEAEGGPSRHSGAVHPALVDAPEASTRRFGHPTCGGAEATAWAARWGRAHDEVRLPRVQGLPQEADYGRGVVRLRDGDADYGLDLVRAGWARTIHHDHLTGDAARYAGELAKAQAAAQAARAGGWGRCGWRSR